MTTYARNVNNCAVDVTTTDPATLFHVDVAAQFITVPDGTENGATFDGKTWTNPAPVTPGSVPIVYPTLTPMQFYLAFKPAERMAIKKSTDESVQEFWATFELAQASGAHIDPNLTSVQEGLDYLAVTNVVPAVAPVWAASSAVTVGQQVSVSNGNTYQCTTAGTTGTAAPSGTGNAISDGSAVWEYVATPYIATSRIADILNGIAQ